MVFSRSKANTEPFIIFCTVICTVENPFVVQVGVRTKNCHTFLLSLTNVLTIAVG